MFCFTQKSQHKVSILALSVTYGDRFPLLSLCDIFPRPGEVFPQRESPWQSPQTLSLCQGLSLWERWHRVAMTERASSLTGKTAGCLYDPSREKSVCRAPQSATNAKLKIIFPLIMRKANAERISNRFLPGYLQNKQRPGFPHPSYGRWKTRALVLQDHQLLALVAFTILAAGSLPMAELLRVLAIWAP